MTLKSNKFDRESVSNKDIRALKRESLLHGDFAQAYICDLALAGDANAFEQCVWAIEQAY